jgi:2-polyprenyl-3-methyl-5-hydroxy-6-metoxy-1,4-benzoquinol methylase
MPPNVPAAACAYVPEMADERQYSALASVYEYLVPDALLDPPGSFAAFREWVGDLPPGAPVLDCACGPGHLAVGLAQAGFAVTATDASSAMTSQTLALAKAHGVALTAAPVTWDELPEQGWDGRFAAVLCVGNSITHAEGAASRRRALRNMSLLLQPGGRLLVTSRNWELVRATGSRLHVADRLVERDGRRGLVIYDWNVPESWTERHRLHVAVALIDDDGGVQTVVEELDFRPFRHEELLEDLAAVGLRVRATTYEIDVDRYLVVACRDS